MHKIETTAVNVSAPLVEGKHLQIDKLQMF